MNFDLNSKRLKTVKTYDLMVIQVLNSKLGIKLRVSVTSATNESNESLEQGRNASR